MVSVGSPCCHFAVPFAAYGLKGQRLAIESTVVDATTGATGTPGRTEATPEADVDQANADVAVDIAVAGRYYVIFVLRGANGTELARSQTDPFDVLS
jgi:hypothetical protein